MTRNFYVLFIITFFMLFSAGASAGESRVLLRNARTDVASLYGMISALPAHEARASFRGLTVDLQTDLWLFHLENFLAAHPELTDDQRAVVLEGIGFLASGMPALRDGQGHLMPNAAYALGVLTERVKLALPRDLASAAFAKLTTDASVDALVRGRRPWAVTPLMGTPECDCSPDSDWCNAENACGPAKCTPTWGCGTLWLYPCSGICHNLCCD